MKQNRVSATKNIRQTFFSGISYIFLNELPSLSQLPENDTFSSQNIMSPFCTNSNIELMKY